MIRLLLIFSFCISLSLSFFTGRIEAFAKPISKSETDLYVEVSALNGLERGSKVLNNGLVVGSISFVDSKKDGSAIIGVDLIKTKLPSSSIAVIKSPMTIDPINRQTLLEFFAPINIATEMMRRGSTIKGFCSFEEFWKADLGKISPSYEAASIS